MPDRTDPPYFQGHVAACRDHRADDAFFDQYPGDGQPNTALFTHDTLFTVLLGADGGAPLMQFALLAALLVIVCGALYWFLLTELGLGLRAVGSNQMMARAHGLSTRAFVITGLGLAGCLAALGGATMSQYQSYADVNMGVGVLVIGLAGTILGEAILGRDTLVRQIAAPVVGSLFYFHSVAMALRSRIQAVGPQATDGPFRARCARCTDSHGKPRQACKTFEAMIDSDDARAIKGFPADRHFWMPRVLPISETLIAARHPVTFRPMDRIVLPESVICQDLKFAGVATTGH